VPRSVPGLDALRRERFQPGRRRPKVPHVRRRVRLHALARNHLRNDIAIIISIKKKKKKKKKKKWWELVFYCMNQ
jgi:hypothetical protein